MHIFGCFARPKKRPTVEIMALDKHLCVETNINSARHGQIVYKPIHSQGDKIIGRTIIAELRESPEYSHIPRVN